MAILVQSTSISSGQPGVVASQPITLTGVTAGNTLIVYAGATGTGLTLTVSDNVNAGNYSQDSPLNNVAMSSGIFSKAGILGGSTTITLTPSSSSGLDIIVEEWKGLLTPVDQTGSGHNLTTGTTGTAGPSGTLSVPSEIGLAMAMTGATVTNLVVAAPFSPSSAGSTIRLAAGNILTGSTSALSATFNWTTARQWSANLATYQVQGGADTLLGAGWV